jgi:hypothetical protein
VNPAPAPDYFAFSLDSIRSRGLLLDTLGQLVAHRESLTVVGAHAVFERTKHLTSEIEMDSTRDADIGVFPELLSSAPLLAEALDLMGLELASAARPGVWGLKVESAQDLRERLTIDFLSPDAIAGGAGRRSADTGNHGKNAVSRTQGTELTLIDRELMPLASFGQGKPIDAYVAGSASLLAAKAWKIFDRLESSELRRNPQRLRPKDAGDLWRLIATTEPLEVQATFATGKLHPAIGDATAVAEQHLLNLLAPNSALAELTIQHFGGRFSDERIVSSLELWLDVYLS